jgi:hypothetical protein
VRVPVYGEDHWPDEDVKGQPCSRTETPRYSPAGERGRDNDDKPRQLTSSRHRRPARHRVATHSICLLEPTISFFLRGLRTVMVGLPTPVDGAPKPPTPAWTKRLARAVMRSQRIQLPAYEMPMRFRPVCLISLL